MNWQSGYLIGADGCCYWEERMVLENPALKSVYQGDTKMHFEISEFAEMGVKVGAA